MFSAVDINKFVTWYNEVFKTTDLYLNMEKTVEGSPWHRERNVGVHTDMVVSQYMIRSGYNFEFDALGAFAAAFHDVGKPVAKKEKWRDDRGNYLSFAGHEQVSARLWENYAFENFDYLNREFGLLPYEIYIIAAMIEHHVPWAIKAKDKLDGIILTFEMNTYEGTFERLLLSDTFGRISDDAEEKQRDSQAWIDREITSRKGWRPKIERTDKSVHFPIGASGSGKTTFVNSRFPNAEKFSLDILRHEWYDADDYNFAFSQSQKDKGFIHKAKKRYVELLQSGVTDLVVDNTNLTRKNRRMWIDEARRRGYTIYGYYFFSDLQTVLDRQNSREDKTVPDDAVTRQYMSIQAPLFYSEFDEVDVISATSNG